MRGVSFSFAFAFMAWQCLFVLCICWYMVHLGTWEGPLTVIVTWHHYLAVRTCCLHLVGILHTCIELCNTLLL